MSPETRQGIQKWISDFIESRDKEEDKVDTQGDKEGTTSELSESATQELTMDTEESRKVKKRQRESDSLEDVPSPFTPDLTDTAPELKKSDKNTSAIIIPSSGSSSSTCDVEGDSSVIDLTQ